MSAHTPGPWRWTLNKKYHEVTLEGAGYDVMRFSRFGMDGAAPSFCRATEMHFRRADEFGVLVPGREHHADWHQTIEHPDATLIAAAPEILHALKVCLDALSRSTTPLPEDREVVRTAQYVAHAAIAKAEGKP